MLTAIQQLQLRDVIRNESMALDTLKRVKAAGFDGIELNRFMLNPLPPAIRLMTRLAGMPMGQGAKLDWVHLLDASDLKVIAVHSDLGSILRDPDAIIQDAMKYKTDTIVMTGMHHFDYSDRAAVEVLIDQLNQAGRLLLDADLRLLYHNHNSEFRHIERGLSAYELIVRETDPALLNFEFDSFWAAEAGVDCVDMMHRLGQRLKLYHINDRGSRKSGKTGSIIKSDSMELGDGNMNLPALIQAAKNVSVDAIVLESHRNWINQSPIESFERSALYLMKEINEGGQAHGQ